MFSLPTVYPITDRQASGLSHAEQVRRLSAAGARLIQLRDKDSASGKFLRDARDAIAVARGFGTMILINDRVDIAMMSGADGVHLGQDDMPPAEARKLLGDAAVIGFSTHDREQAAAALTLPIDYVAAGPVFSTSSKADTSPVIGTEGLAGIRSAIGAFPLVAIGGINARNAGSVLAFTDAVAVISCLFSDKRSIEESFRLVADAAEIV